MLALLASSACAFERGGDPNCRCIDIRSFYESDNSSSVSFTRDYGSNGCRPYDLVETAECNPTDNATVPRWCRDRWCYIHLANCKLPRYVTSLPSTTVRLKQDLLPVECQAEANATCLTLASAACDRRLYYSYETCGNLDSFSVAGAMERELRNLTGGRLVRAAGSNPQPLPCSSLNRRQDGPSVSSASRLHAAAERAFESRSLRG